MATGKIHSGLVDRARLWLLGLLQHGQRGIEGGAQLQGSVGRASQASAGRHLDTDADAVGFRDQVARGQFDLHDAIEHALSGHEVEVDQRGVGNGLVGRDFRGVAQSTLLGQLTGDIREGRQQAVNWLTDIPSIVEK